LVWEWRSETYIARQQGKFSTRFECSFTSSPPV
jgi:hypothetical protein